MSVEGGAANEGATGEDIRGSTLLSRAPLPAPEASFLGELTATQIAELGAYAWRALRMVTPAGAAATVFGLLFIPSRNDIHVEGDVPEIPGLRYSWSRDETQIHFIYDNPAEGHLTFARIWTANIFAIRKGALSVWWCRAATSLSTRAQSRTV